MMHSINYQFTQMDYYYDRASRSNYLEIANKCINGILILWDKLYFDANICEENIFTHEFDGENVASKTEYLHAMDYLSYVLTAYKETGNDIYKNTFNKYIHQFYEYSRNYNIFRSELSVWGQTLLIIKAIDILGEIPHQNYFYQLLIQHAKWLSDEKKHHFTNNHELFLNIALLHISVLLNDYPESTHWQKYATSCINKMFLLAYYDDYTNNENSIFYFNYNNNLYSKIVDFCKHYNILGINKIEFDIENSKEALITFAHSDNSLPIIGDGEVFHINISNGCSRLFHDIGIAVFKTNDVYFSFKGKTNIQSHAHIDISSITARYKNIDFISDSGQYNYDKYTPINRYLRSSAGHSGIFPLFADKMFQKDFCDAISYSEITDYKHNENNSYVKGEYQLRDVKVCREVHISKNEIIIKDSWKCETATTMRQRFIIPKDLLEHSKFTVSKRTLETKVGNNCFKFEIIPAMETAVTEVQFGVASPQYYEYQTTMLLDTYVENSTLSEITSKISFWEE